MTCKVGESYSTRLGRLTLLGREDVGRLLVEIPSEVAKPLLEMDLRVQPKMLECMRAWLSVMAEICEKRAKEQGVKPQFGCLYLTSAFRPIGTTAGSGAYSDKCGALDSHDEYGHWSGWAIDCPTRYTRESFFPPLTITECRSCAKRAGLVRPFAEEWWHFRPRKGIITG